jgi:hypothetical protein
MVNGPSRAGAKPSENQPKADSEIRQEMQQRNICCIDARFVNSDSTIAVI